MLGLQQPLHKRVTFVADWTSGDTGVVGGGFRIAVKKSVVGIGYNAANNGRGANWISVLFGHSF